ncbi:MAG TPA: trehalose-phosphatase, partial [Segetibacter sp.]|nr:trehalose-phosphatase [Segetibacter sp.]
WVNDFLDQLFKIKKEQEKLHVKRLDESVEMRLKTDYEKANKRCILLDYDGTLAPLTKIPSEASPSKEVVDFLEQLCNDEKNEVVIISGRDADTLQKWLGQLYLNFIAEHGAAIKYKNGDWELQTNISTGWKDEIRPMLQAFVRRCAGSFLEEKQNTLSWHYRNTYSELGFIRSRELLNNLLQLTTNTPIQIVDGNKVLEVRLTGMDKGMTASKLMNKFNPDFALCIGDDTTDEDMFKALQGQAYTIKVGNGSTAANYNLRSQVEVLPLLKRVLTSEKVEV